MNALRSAPFRPLLLASALQVFIFSCWVLPFAAAEPAAPEAAAVAPVVAAVLFSDRQLLVKVLRPAPFNPLAVASALPLVILCCWLFPWEAWAMAWPAPIPGARPPATRQV